MSRTILITGASSGIGRTTAAVFADHDWNVVVTMRKPSDGEELARRPNVLVIGLDLVDPDSIREAVAAVVDEGARTLLGRRYSIEQDEAFVAGMRARCGL